MIISWEKIYEEYKGLWVALMDDETTVVGSGKTAKEALLEARRKGYLDPILARMPRELTSYVGLDEHEI